MFRKLSALAAVAVVFVAGCGSRSQNPVEDLGGTEDMSRFALTSLNGTRDGDRVRVQAVYTDGSQELKVHLQFNLAPQAKLESGTWAGPAGEGTVRQRSVTFLGGQSGPPSIGGTFDLIASSDRAEYRVTIPLQPLKQTPAPGRPAFP